jgi:hypothetical protein
MDRFHDLLAEEIRETEQRARAHDRAGTSDLADWWRRRGEDLRSYLEGARLQQAAPSPGQRPVTRPPSPALRRTG